MKPQDSERVGEFLQWVEDVYGVDVRRRCEDRIAQLPHDEDFDAMSFVSDAFCEDCAGTIEVVDRMSRCAFGGQLHLE